METVRDVLSVLAVFALLGAALWALRRGAVVGLAGVVKGWPGAFVRQGQGRVKSLETVERMALTPQHSLHLVRINGRELLVATHPQGCALLDGSGGQQ